MGIQVAIDEKHWVDLAWNWMHSQIPPHSRVFVPAGQTPLPIYQKWERTPSSLLKSLKLVQLDEILDGPARGRFRYFFHQEMGNSLNQFEWIEAATKGADVAIVGVGLNGHVAFHEPYLPKEFYSGCVPLTSETLRHLALNNPTWAITYGVAAFQQCQKILVLARGEKKRQVLQKALETKTLPIGWLMEHRDVTLIADFELSSNTK